MSNYDSSSIKVLQDISNGLHHMVFEVVEKALMLHEHSIMTMNYDDVSDETKKNPSKVIWVCFDHKKAYQPLFLLTPCINKKSETSLSWTQLLKETRKLARVPPVYNHNFCL